MSCERHPESRGMVCGEFVCGMCYGERLLSEPMVPAPRLSPYVLVFDESRHVMVPVHPESRRGRRALGL